MKTADVAAPPRMNMSRANGEWRWSVTLADGTSIHGTADDMEQAFILIEGAIRDNSPSELH